MCAHVWRGGAHLRSVSFVFVSSPLSLSLYLFISLSLSVSPISLSLHICFAFLVLSLALSLSLSLCLLYISLFLSLFLFDSLFLCLLGSLFLCFIVSLFLSFFVYFFVCFFLLSLSETCECGFQGSEFLLPLSGMLTIQLVKLMEYGCIRIPRLSESQASVRRNLCEHAVLSGPGLPLHLHLFAPVIPPKNLHSIALT